MQILFMFYRLQFTSETNLTKLNVALNSFDSINCIAPNMAYLNSEQQIVFAQGHRLYSANTLTGNINLIVGNEKPGYEEGTFTSAKFLSIQSFVQVLMYNEWRFIVVDSQENSLRWVFSSNRTTKLIVNHGQFSCLSEITHLCNPRNIVLKNQNKLANTITSYIAQPSRDEVLNVLIERETVEFKKINLRKKSTPLCLALKILQNSVQLYISTSRGILKHYNNTRRIIKAFKLHSNGYKSAALLTNLTVLLYMGSNQLFMTDSKSSIFGILNLDTSIFSPICSKGDSLLIICQILKTNRHQVLSATLVNSFTMLLGGSMGFITINCKSEHG